MVVESKYWAGFYSSAITSSSTAAVLSDSYIATLYDTGAREYVRTLQVAFDLHLSVGILRLQGGFDISSLGFTEVASDGEESRYKQGNLTLF